MRVENHELVEVDDQQHSRKHLFPDGQSDYIYEWDDRAHGDIKAKASDSIA